MVVYYVMDYAARFRPQKIFQTSTSSQTTKIFLSCHEIDDTKQWTDSQSIPASRESSSS